MSGSEGVGIICGYLYWQFAQSPWWEYAAVMDQYNGFVKAPKVPRAGEPSAYDVDEVLDSFEENLGKIDVLSPQTLHNWSVKGLTESYLKRLDRI